MSRAKPLFERCLIRNNRSSKTGGGVYVESGNAKFTNCILYSNQAGTGGGGAYVSSTAPDFTNCTIVYNKALNGYGGGGVRNASGADYLNCILWGNTPDNSYSHWLNGDPGDYAECWNGDVKTQDPDLKDVSSFDFRLYADSPCIDAGSESGVGSTAPDEDFTEIERPQGDGYDIGAHEFLSGYPVVEISSPADGTTFPWNPGLEVVLEGSAEDPEEGPLTDDRLVWASSLDGELGSGARLSVPLDILSYGDHTITLAATDEEGVWDSASISITIEPNQDPEEVEITSPSDGASYSYVDDITLSGSATDAEDGPLTGDALVWTSSQDGDLGTGEEVLLSRGTLTLGPHDLTLTATDSGNASVSATVTITVESHTPEVEIASPSDGASYSYVDAITLSGSATDEEDGPLTGASLVWTSSLDGELGTGEEVLLAGETLSEGIHELTLTATDSDDLDAAESITITIESNQAPEVTIASPSDGASYSYVDDITLSGSATDEEDGPLTGASLVWTSSLDGELGTGEEVLLAGDTLSEGIHELTLTATDSDDLDAADSITITIESNQAPEVTIDSPSDGASYSYVDDITLSGSATDEEDGPLTGASLVWTSSLDGELGTGEEVLLAGDTLSEGIHELTLTATDSDDLDAADSITITIESNQAPEVTIDSPTNGENYMFSEEITILGSAEDPEEGELNGTSLVWTSSLDGALGTGEELTLAGGTLSPGNHVLTLTATDSRDLKGTASVSISVGGAEVVIDSPEDGASYAYNESVSLSGSAEDPEDGTLSGDALVWNSDLNGELGIGSPLELAGERLSVGSHVVSLIATDGDNVSMTASVTIEVRENEAPVVIIDRPSDGESFRGGESIALSGSAEDAEDGTLTEDSLVWTSDQDGEVGRGEQVVLAAGVLREGEHALTLEAIDSALEVTTETIEVTILGVPAVLRVPSEYHTIQEGIDAASDYDTVLVAPGTYTGDGNRDLQFTGAEFVLLSEAGPDSTVIDCEEVSGGVTCNNDQSLATILSGFTITNGLAGFGGAVHVIESSLTIRNCRLIDNLAVLEGAESSYSGATS